MRHWWWKFLGVALLLYVVIVGLRTPLSPALISRSPDRIAAGDIEVDVQGYNTRFTEGIVEAWIENDSQCVRATGHEVLDDEHAELRFTVPSGFRAAMSDLVVRTRNGGDLPFYDAFYTEDRGAGIANDAGRPTAIEPPKAFAFPDRNILNESIRNLFFHVPMWFTMLVLMGLSVVKSVRVLRTNALEADRSALAAVQVGLLFTVLGLITGSLWARATWGAWWTNDVKLNGAAVGALIYLAYLVLRGSVPDAFKRARLAAIYNIFAFCFLVLFLFVVPRLNAVDSLHPGNGGNPAFGTYDLDNRLRAVFYPACIGWILLGLWMYDLRNRVSHLQHHLNDATDR